MNTSSGAGGTATRLESRDDAKDLENVVVAPLLLPHLARLNSDNGCLLTPGGTRCLRLFFALFAARCTEDIGGVRRENDSKGVEEILECVPVDTHSCSTVKGNAGALIKRFPATGIKSCL